MKKGVNELDVNQVEKLSKLIESSLKKSDIDATFEINTFYKEVSNNIKSDLFYKKIIEWKTKFIKSKSSIYYVLSQNRSIHFDFGTSDSERISKLTLIYFLNFHNTKTFNFELLCEAISEEVYEFHKYKKLHLSISNMITTINMNEGVEFKFPKIDDFETTAFTKMFQYQNELYHNYKNLLSKYEKEVKNLIEEKHSISTELINKEFELNKKIRSINSKLEKKKRKTTELSNKVENLKNYLELLKIEIAKKDYFSNPQFSNLYWGDNYPALKVFFEFLQVNQIYQYSWSHFASQMSIGDLTIIQFHTGNINKTELGYLFYQIKSFFSLEYKNTNIRYLDFLKRKFAIDDKFIDDTYCKNNIRNYKKSKYSIKTKEELDFLCSNIASRYF
jgi:hypothetical protein